jgi:hypothetical protein
VSYHGKDSTHTGQHDTEESEYTSMSGAEFEPTIPVFKQLKSRGALDRAAAGSTYTKFFLLLIAVNLNFMDMKLRLMAHYLISRKGGEDNSGTFVFSLFCFLSLPHAFTLFA